MAETLSHDVVAAARHLAPQIRAASAALETTRQFPSALVDALAVAGLFQLYLPQAMGGLEVPPLTAFRAIEALSQVDGAVGWCAMIAVAESLFLGWLSPEVGRTLFGQPPNVRMAGSLRPEGKAWVVEGGYRVQGRWDFASGINHANWLMCTCVVMEGDRPCQNAAGLLETRILLVPVTQATLVDTWSVVGLCGTGSQDFVVDNVFVPASHTYSLAASPQAPGPLYHPRLLFTVAWAPTVANALGMARGAIDTFIALASQAHSTSSTTLLRDRPLVQARVAEAEAMVRAARAYVCETIGAAWDAVCTGLPDPSQEIAQARLALTHGMHEAVRAVDLVFHAAGTNAVYRKHRLERYFRDVHTAVQHAAGLHANIENAGKVLLGLRPHDLGW
jgi:alkylation response protein AidB-like acyl-CoA dehydrogenase